MTHPQNNFTSQFQEGASSGNAALTLNINGVSQTYTPQGTDQTIAISEPVVFESSENPTFAEVNEVIGTHNPVYIHVSGIGVDYMIPYVGQSGDGNKLYFVIPDAQVGGFRYHIIRNGAPPDIGVKSVTDFLESYMTNPVEGKTIAASLNELNARLSSVEDAQTEKNIGDRTADSLDAQSLSVGGVPVKRQQTPKSLNGSTAKTVTGFSQDENGELNATFDDIAFPDWTSAINAAVATCENLENKKTTVTGFESSNNYYPTIKAVVDFVNGMLQNLGGKLITDNGDPFTSSASLPSSTPYGGVDIADKDYAYVQGVGTAERWSATVSGSSVTWLQEYAISIPVFTPSQQAAIDSGVTSAMLGTFLTKTGNGSDVTASFTTAGSRNNISTGEKLSVIFGKIAKWFGDIGTLAFKSSVANSDISGTIADAHIASASTWNAKQNALPNQTAYAFSGINNAVPNITTNSKGCVTDIKWENIPFPSVPSAYSSTPNAVDGTAASAGSSSSWARGDHRHQLSLAASGTRGGIQIGYSESGKYYAVKLSGEKAYVHVPWTDSFSGKSVIDNLTSTSTTDVLSANQGKVLNTSLTSHATNTAIHVTQDNKNAWNKASREISEQTFFIPYQELSLGWNNGIIIEIDDSSSFPGLYMRIVGNTENSNGFNFSLQFRTGSGVFLKNAWMQNSQYHGCGKVTTRTANTTDTITKLYTSSGFSFVGGSTSMAVCDPTFNISSSYALGGCYDGYLSLEGSSEHGIDKIYIEVHLNFNFLSGGDTKPVISGKVHVTNVANVIITD